MKHGMFKKICCLLTVVAAVCLWPMQIFASFDLPHEAYFDLADAEFWGSVSRGAIKQEFGVLDARQTDDGTIVYVAIDGQPKLGRLILDNVSPSDAVAVAKAILQASATEHSISSLNVAYCAADAQSFSRSINSLSGYEAPERIIIGDLKPTRMFDRNRGQEVVRVTVEDMVLKTKKGDVNVPEFYLDVPYDREWLKELVAGDEFPNWYGEALLAIRDHFRLDPAKMIESPFKMFRRLTPEGDSLAYDFASGWLIVESCEEVEPRQGETITSSPPSEPVDAPPPSFDNMPKPYEPKPDPFGDERSEDGHESGTLENGGIGNQVPVIDLPHGYPGEQTTRLDAVRYAIASTTALAFEIGNLDEDEINEILSAFVDANHIPPEFRREVAAAVKYGLIDGGPENSLGIFDIVTEEEINLILARAAEAEQRILSQPSNDHAVETTPEPRGPGTGAGSRAPVSRSMLRLMGGLLAGTVVLTIVFLYKYKKVKNGGASSL